MRSSLCHFLQVKEAIFKTLITNGMFDNAHIRLTLTRGKKVSSNSSFQVYHCSLISFVLSVIDKERNLRT